MAYVQPSRSDKAEEFFGCKAYLTVSGQLQAEALARCGIAAPVYYNIYLIVQFFYIVSSFHSGMHSVYTFGPTFRAEKSHTRRHLSEFYMVEAETVTMETGMQSLLDLIERTYKTTVEAVLRESEADVELFHKQIARPETKVGRRPLSLPPSLLLCHSPPISLSSFSLSLIHSLSSLFLSLNHSPLSFCLFFCLSERTH